MTLRPIQHFLARVPPDYNFLLSSEGIALWALISVNNPSAGSSSILRSTLRLHLHGVHHSILCVDPSCINIFDCLWLIDALNIGNLAWAIALVKLLGGQVHGLVLEAICFSQIRVASLPLPGMPMKVRN